MKTKHILTLTLLIFSLKSPIFGQDSDYVYQVLLDQTRQSSKYGFVDNSGNLIFSLPYGDLSRTMRSTFDGGFLVQNKKSLYIVNGLGEEVLKVPNHNYRIEQIDDELFTVRKKRDGRYEKPLMLNINLDTLVRSNYNYISRFSEGLAFVHKGDNAGYIDRDGSLRIQLKFNAYMRSNNEGDKIFLYNEGFHNGYAIYYEGDKRGLIDKQGEVVIEAKYDYMEHFSDGLVLAHMGDERSFIDLEARKVLSRKEGEVLSGSYKNNLVIKGDESTGGTRYGYADINGEWVLPPMYRNVRSFNNGLANVRFENWSGGIIDTLGNVLLRGPKTSARSLISFSDDQIIKVDVGYDMLLNTDLEVIWSTPCKGRNVRYPIFIEDCDFTEIRRMTIEWRNATDTHSEGEWKILLEKSNPVKLEIRGFRKAFPTEILEMSNLRTLEINGFSEPFLTKDIGRLSNLVNLSLVYCKLKSLPEEVFILPKLKMLNIGNNEFSEEYLQMIRKRLPEVRVYSKGTTYKSY